MPSRATGSAIWRRNQPTPSTTTAIISHQKFCNVDPTARTIFVISGISTFMSANIGANCGTT